GGENDALGHMIDVDAHRDALGQPHPGEDRVDLRKSSGAGLRIGDIDAARDAADVAADDVAITHELDLHRVALANGPKAVSVKYPSTQKESASTTLILFCPTVA